MAVEKWVQNRAFKHDPARWIVGRLDDLNIGIDIDERVRGLIAVDEPGRTLLLPPGLTWDAAHYLICRGCLYLSGGPSWAPEFEDPPRLDPIEDSAGKVVPFIRRQW